MELFYPSITAAVLMYIWFETEAFEEYMQKLGLGSRMFGLAGYAEEKKKIPSLDYHTYLLMNFSNSFFIKLFTCPVCLITWVAPLTNLAYNGTEDFGPHVLFYEVLFGWVLFFMLKIIVKKSDS